MRVEWYRSQVVPPGSEGVPDLVDRVRAEIESSGPITFARFMERALYEPGLGYYATSASRPTRAGDFLTAPELHPLFGHVVARQVDEIWRRMGRPDKFTLSEYGSSGGALFLALLDGLVRIDSPLAAQVRYRPVDLPLQQRRAGEALGLAGLAERLDSGEADSPFIGCVIANEFVDALPVHRVARIDGRLQELYIGRREGAFVEMPDEPSDARLEAWFAAAGITLAEGQHAEVNLAMLDWLAEVGRRLERGCVLIFDYGERAADLYGPERLTGSLRAFAGQHVSSDVLGGMGTRDITAHVDLDALERGAAAASLDVLGTARQAEFLLGSGLDEAYAAARREAETDWHAALALRSTVRRLLDPQALGGYWVVILGRGFESQPSLIGLSSPAARSA